jgi:hypothetical protein
MEAEFPRIPFLIRKQPSGSDQEDNPPAGALGVGAAVGTPRCAASLSSAEVGPKTLSEVASASAFWSSTIPFGPHRGHGGAVDNST